MCLRINYWHHAEVINANGTRQRAMFMTGIKPKIALRDHVVFKILLEDDTSPYQGFQYESDTLYRLRKPLAVREGSAVDKGFHAFTSFNQAASIARWKSGQKVVGMIVPKGARYFLGYGDVVSTSLRSGHLLEWRSSGGVHAALNYSHFPS